MLILRTLERGPAHGHDVSKSIQQASYDVLQVDHGSLYPALHRLVKRGLITSAWEFDASRNREFRFYRLTASGRRHLLAEERQWRRVAEAIGRVMWPAEAQ